MMDFFLIIIWIDYLEFDSDVNKVLSNILPKIELIFSNVLFNKMDFKV
jgi:hypothetical protein